MKEISRATVEKLQQAMATMPQARLNTRHWFADGMYCREMDWPAGVTIVGKVHKREHLFILLKGEATFSTAEGMQRVRAPCVIVGTPNTKRIGYAHEDSVCLNVHRTDQRDLDLIEIELIEPDDKALFDSGNNLKTDRLENTCPG
jgi:hypothetical protein